MNQLIKFILKEALDNNGYELGLLKELENITKS